jgi:DNA-binding transcriptional ArsR family regulator
MRAKREYRSRDETDVAVLDALVERGRDGMTVFELRSQADVEIDDLEGALSDLKDDDLIDVDREDGRTLIKPDERVVPDPDADGSEEEPSLFERLRYVIDRLRS